MKNVKAVYCREEIMNEERENELKTPEKDGSAKKSRKKIIIGSAVSAFAVIVCIILAVALSRKQPENEPASNNSGEPTAAVTLTPTAAQTPTPTPTPKPESIGKANPLGIQGYEYFDSDEAVNDSGDVFYKAYIAANSMVDGKYLYDIGVYSYDGDVFWDYLASDVPQFSDITEDTAAPIGYFGGCISKEDNSVKKKEFPLDTTLLRYQNGQLTALTGNGSDFIRTTYDNRMMQTGELTITNGENICSSEDGERCYFLRSRKIYVCGTDGEEHEVVPDIPLRIGFIGGVMTDENGIDHLFVYGQAGDMNSYSIIINADTGKVEYISGMTDSNIIVQDNTYLETVYDEDYNCSKWIFGRNGTRYDYSWADRQEYLSIYMPDDDRILFFAVEGTEIRLYLYSYESAEFIGSTEFSIPTDYDESSWEYAESGIYMKNPVVMTDENGLLLQLADGAGNWYFYVWKPGSKNGPESKMTIEKHEDGSRPSVEIVDKYDLSQYTPSEVSPELRPLRERADELENRFGVEIRIGEECADIIGGYAITPLTEYDRVKDALDVLEAELSKYPDNFLAQMKTDYITVNSFYLAGTLLGVEEGTLGMAGGFQCEYDGKQLIVIDSNDLYSLQSTIHHELFHSIEDYMAALSDMEGLDGTVYLSEAEWQKLNPPVEQYGDCYTYTYEEFGYEENFGLTYDLQFYADEDLSGTYFVDTYSMTFPQEDRARIFESVMCDFYIVDFDAAPHLKAKLDYMAECIRSAFDTTGWEEVPWEL